MDTQIKFREKVGYGLGDAASSMFWKLFGSYLLFFYTDIFGLPAAAVGTMFLITRFWDSSSGYWPTGHKAAGGNSGPTCCGSPSPSAWRAY